MEIGVKIGKSKQWVSEFERGNIRLNIDVAVELAKVLGVTADIFLPRKSKNISRD
jgi:putative transcriptional regulator